MIREIDGVTYKAKFDRISVYDVVRVWRKYKLFNFLTVWLEENYYVPCDGVGDYPDHLLERYIKCADDELRAAEEREQQKQDNRGKLSRGFWLELFFPQD